MPNGQDRGKELFFSFVLFRIFWVLLFDRINFARNWREILIVLKQEKFNIFMIVLENNPHEHL